MSADQTSTLRNFVSLQRGTTYKGALVGLPGPVLLGLASIEPNGGFRYGGFKTYGGECPEKISLKPGDLYVSLKDVTQSGDLLGSVSRIPLDISSGRLTQDTVKLVFDGEPISESYVYWLLRTPAYREYCRGYATGTTTLGLARDDFLNFPVPIPTSAESLLVVVLEGIERRITLLRETNTTLETIAQALFKSWFVDFDPVRAKAEGLQPRGMDAATAALFPDSFEESELGLVPKGWRVSTLGAICNLNGGLIQTGPFGSQLHASDYVTDGVPVVMPRDISNRRVDVTSAARVRIEDANRLAKHQLREGDIVFSRRGDVEKHALIGEAEQGWLCGTGCLLVRPGLRRTVASYLSRSLDLSQTKQWLTQHAVGATMPNLNTGILSGVPVLLPTDGVLETFELMTHAIDKRISAGNAAAQTLTHLRDTLLPRLISGQLRLSDAEKLAEQVVA